MSTLRRLWPKLRHDRARLLAVVVLLLVSGAMPGLTVWALQRLTTAALAGEPGLSLMLGLSLLGLATADVAVRLLRTTLSKKVAWGLVHRLRVDLHRRWLAAPVDQQPAPGVLLASLLEAADDVQYGISALMGMLRDPLSLAGLLVVGLWLSPTLVLVALLITPLVAVALGLVGRLVQPRVDAMHEARGVLTELGAEQIRRAELLQAYGVEQAASERFEQAVAHDAARRHSLDVARVVPSLASQLAVGTLVVVLLVTGASEVAAGRIAGADLVAFAAALGLVRRPLQGLAESRVLALRCEAALDRLADAPELPAPSGTISLPSGPLSVALSDVSVTRGRGEVLHSVSLEVASSQWVALVGATGAGKSTLLRVVAGLQAYEGRVDIGGAALASLDRGERTVRVGWAAQADATGASTVRQELLLGRPTSNDAALWRSLETAQLADLVRSLPLGLDTPLAALGRDLSGGEQQRLQLARALVLEPDLLLLDEATSHLDAPTTTALLAALRALPWRPTVLWASHDPLVINAVDEVVELDQGVVVSRAAREAS